MQRHAEQREEAATIDLAMQLSEERVLAQGLQLTRLLRGKRQMTQDS